MTKEPGGKNPEHENSPHSLISHSQLRISSPNWPTPLGCAAYHGLAGDIVKTIEPQSEADPVALMVQLLVAFGNIVGHRPRFVVEADHHTMNLFTVLVGETSKARKGTAWGQVQRLCARAEREWAGARVKSGLVSGEGLIWDVRDQDDESTGTEKRLLVIESEFASVLKVTQRKENILSAVMRQAWDDGNLRTLSKNNPGTATNAHVSIVGHITREELRKDLTTTETANGFANRFLWLCVRRSKVLPEGGLVEESEMARLAERLRTAQSGAKTVDVLTRDQEARLLWAEVYPTLSEGCRGMFGAVTSRAEAQVTRLSCIYALLDSSRVVRGEHMRAGLEVWRYAEDSARYIFGDVCEDPVTERIRLELTKVSDEGLNRTEISSLLGRHVKSSDISQSLAVLQQQERAFMKIRNTNGRSVERWFAKREISEKSARSPFA